MTIQKAQRITGLDIELQPLGRQVVAVALHFGQEVARSVAGPPKKSLEILVDIIYRRRADQSMAEQGYRCLMCNRIRPLQCHHIVLRSRGRSDDRKNLTSLCAECHDDITLNKKKLIPHPVVLEKVAQCGLTWDWENSGWVEITT